jgi:hypothetical protein
MAPCGHRLRSAPRRSASLCELSLRPQASRCTMKSQSGKSSCPIHSLAPVVECFDNNARRMDLVDLVPGFGHHRDQRRRYRRVGGEAALHISGMLDTARAMPIPEGIPIDSVSSRPTGERTPHEAPSARTQGSSTGAPTGTPGFLPATPRPARPLSGTKRMRHQAVR